MQYFGADGVNSFSFQSSTISLYTIPPGGTRDEAYRTVPGQNVPADFSYRFRSNSTYQPASQFTS